MTDVYERCEKCKQFHSELIPCTIPKPKQAITWEKTERETLEDEIDAHANNCIICQIAYYDLIENHLMRLKKR